ncbi:Surface antigen [Cnuella takakiae]|uniref:Surface antigen n=2 Tax=Cnuella takakiae TaxID=1302690 RepID=A0A1M5E4E2_9BACT|nr:Surface antigen [Cnuella takakiae]
MGQEYRVQYHGADTAAEKVMADWPRKFNDRQAAKIFINKLPDLLQAAGFVAAATDSVHAGTQAAEVWLYPGPRCRWVHIRNTPVHRAVLDAVGWPANANCQPWQPALPDSLLQRILTHLEQRGHPFGKVWFDSIQLRQDTLAVLLAISPGPLYLFDSIHIEGGVRLRPAVLARMLDLLPRTPFDRRKLDAIGAKMAALPYLSVQRPPAVKMLATGAVVQLYLKPKRSSQVQALVGMQPATVGGKSRNQLTGEARLLLQNSLGMGETIGFNWQRLQVASPRLQLQYEHPYLLGSPVSLDLRFDLLRRDSSWLNLHMHLGGRLKQEGTKWIGFFWAHRQTILGSVDTLRLRRSRSLPAAADMGAQNLGINLGIDNPDPFPIHGWALHFSGSGGLRKLRPNSQVLDLKDGGFDFARLYDTVQSRTYQLRVQGSAAHYQALGRMSVLKQGIQLGILQSSNYYVNELFQVGGFRMLRGFSEESLFMSHYLLGTLEYRYRIGEQSYFMGFVDGGMGKNAALKQPIKTYLGTGAGLALGTRAGIFNLVWAAGKSSDTRFNLRQSKLHLGLVNRF